MGDHRASIEIKFSMHGHEDKVDFWINWTPDDDTGVDRRVTEWVAEQARIAMDKYWDAEFDADQIRKADQENAERDELRRLKAKYESTPPEEGGE